MEKRRKAPRLGSLVEVRQEGLNGALSGQNALSLPAFLS